MSRSLNLVERRLNIAGVPTLVENYLIPSNVEDGQFALETTVTAYIGKVT